MSNLNPMLSPIALRKLAAWAGAVLILGSGIGLAWVFDAFVPQRFTALNVPSIAIAGDCRGMAYARASYKVDWRNASPQTTLLLDLEKPKCESLTVTIVDGAIEIGPYRTQSGLPAAQSGPPPSGDARTARFDLSAFRDRRWVSLSMPLTSRDADLLEAHERSGLVRRKSFAEYLVVGRTTFSVGAIERGPEVAASFAHELDITPHGATITEDVPLSPDMGRSFMVAPVPWRLDLGNEGYTGLVLQEGRSWHMQFRVVSRELQRRRDMMIVLFSTLIGVGISVLLESLLSAEAYRALAGLAAGLRRRGPSEIPPGGESGA